MRNQTERKIILITRKTPVEELIYKFNNLAQATFYVESMGGSMAEYKEESATYEKAVTEVAAALGAIGRVQRLDRSFVSSFLFGADDIVVVLGQDGLVANTMKYLKGQPLIAINPDGRRFDGVLLPFAPKDASAILQEVIQNRRPMKAITMAEATLNDGQQLLAVNDFFIGRSSHASAKYHIAIGNEGENQSSSGVIVSTGLGSTGWLKSVITGAQGVVLGSGGRTIEPLSWDSNTLYYSVREPFPSQRTGASLVFGKIETGALEIASQMPEHGVIFSDGIEQDFLQFHAGMKVKICVARGKGALVV